MLKDLFHSAILKIWVRFKDFKKIDEIRCRLKYLLKLVKDEDRIAY